MKRRESSQFWMKVVLGFGLMAMFLWFPLMGQNAVLPINNNSKPNILWSFDDALSGLKKNLSSTISTPTEHSIIVSTRPTINDSSDSNISNSNSSYKILGFTDEWYLDHATRWFQELTEKPVSYPKQNVVVAAMSLETLTQLQARNITSQPCGFSIVDPSQKQHIKPLRRRRRLFAARWKCVLHELKQGTHVILTDVDNHFTRHVPIVESFAHWNVMHAYSNGFPLKLHAKHGFTVCGGMSWLQSHPATIRFVERVVQRCGEACDDQVVLNSLLLEDLDVEWTIDSATLEEHNPQRILKSSEQHRFKNTTSAMRETDKHNWKEPYAARHGLSNVTGHSIYIWNREFAYRGPLEAHPCPRTVVNWVAMPSNQKGQKMARLWKEYCPSTHSNAHEDHQSLMESPARSSSQQLNAMYKDAPFPPLSALPKKPKSEDH